MEEEGVEVVLARAIELRLKISNCIHKATTNSINANINGEESKPDKNGVDVSVLGEEEKGENPNPQSPLTGRSLSEDEEDEEPERLLHIRDALESLENQLSNLQDLQQQQRYEREIALSEIELSRKMLLDKLKEYKGVAIEVIQEASAFAGETVKHNNDLLLPPYPSRLPQSLSHFPSTRKSMRNGIISSEVKNKLNGLDSNEGQKTSKNSSKGWAHVIGVAAKTVITLVGVVSVLSLSGFGKKNAPFKILGMFQQSATEGNRSIGCPPGRVLVLEDGEARCVVKERVAIPFESVATKPDLKYGCG